MKIIDEMSQPSLTRDVGKLGCVNLSPGELLDFIKSMRNQFINFSVEKLNKFSELTFRSEQEFGPDGVPGDIDNDGHEEVVGFPRNFLVIYMIEFFILEKKPDILDSYLSYVRVSGAKRYADDLRKIFTSVV
jgi:hypothetical protein